MACHPEQPFTPEQEARIREIVAGFAGSGSASCGEACEMIRQIAEVDLTPAPAQHPLPRSSARAVSSPYQPGENLRSQESGECHA